MATYDARPVSALGTNLIKLARREAYDVQFPGVVLAEGGDGGRAAAREELGCAVGLLSHGRAVVAEARDSARLVAVEVRPVQPRDRGAAVDVAADNRHGAVVVRGDV